MDYHYDSLLAVFDGWIVVLMVALAVIAGVRLRGTRRLFVAGGFGICALATILWLPAVSGMVLAPLAATMAPDLVWQLPAVPWTIGIVLTAVGIFRQPQGHADGAASFSWPAPAADPPPDSEPSGPATHSPAQPGAPDFAPPASPDSGVGRS